MEKKVSDRLHLKRGKSQVGKILTYLSSFLKITINTRDLKGKKNKYRHQIPVLNKLYLIG